MTEYLYRYRVIRYYSPELKLMKYPIIRRTPCGAWIEGRFVLLTARKKWACESEEEARESFIARRQRQIRILKAQLTEAEEDLRCCLASPMPTLRHIVVT